MVANGAGKTSRPREESGAGKETLCSLTKAITRAHGIQTPRGGSSLRHQGRVVRVGSPALALGSSPVHAPLARSLMHAPAAFRCCNKQPLEPTDPGL